MADSNPNTKTNTDPYPRGFDAAKVRSEVDPPVKSSFESDLAKLDREAGSEKGGR